ncbi:MAG: ABC transporter substrate-binding protein [Candidatus Lambdaproteobacteria bacterium]|nr:ABC transporter substrate-binding protein [Candidatus Lambdaproteobacteria bacterium]
MTTRTIAAAIVAVAVSLAWGPPAAIAQKYGGILKSIQRDNPNSLSSHDESGSFVAQWPVGGVYNSVLYFDPLKPVESFDTVIPELAKSRQWSTDHKTLTFTLNQGVRWHDGKPFTAADVKHTFDVVRNASPQKLRINPRKTWWTNVKDITTNGDHEVTFHLGRPQPSIVLMLASGLSPVYPKHVPLAQIRTEAMGTGPFKLVEFKRDAYLKVRKNDDYFVKGRPYLDGIDYIVIKNKATRIAALQSGQVDVNQPTETDEPVYKTLKATVPDMEFNKTATNSFVNVVLNVPKPPFDNPKLRRAVSMAMDRVAYTGKVQPGYIVGGFMLGRPHGAWGLTDADLAGLPGYRDPELDKEEARKLMRELGYSEQNRLKLKVTTQNVANMRDGATWALGELKQIYVDAELDVREIASFYPSMARKEFVIAAIASASAIDDPDAIYYEHFSCASVRNYASYCSKELDGLIEKQSSTIDQQQRVALVGEVERLLIHDVPRISIGFRVNYNARRGYVKNFVGHSTTSNWLRMQDVWLDK